MNKNSDTDEECVPKVIVQSTSSEISNNNDIVSLLRSSPIPDGELNANLSLYLTRQHLSHILLIDKLYQKIVNNHGVIMEFGVRWGRNLSLFSALKGIYEPFNHNRKIVGFDTFNGFEGVSSKDGKNSVIETGSYSVGDNYEMYLDNVLKCHHQNNPISHLKTYELVKGNASVKLAEYLKDHPETIISLAYFDFDIYQPTRDCLELIKPHLNKGSIIAFDELNNSLFPGETIAFQEVLGLNNYIIYRDPNNPNPSYIIFG